MKMFAALLFAGALSAQTLTISGPTAPVRPNGPVTLNVSLSGSAGANLAALQFSFAPPGGLTTSSFSQESGAASTAASKTVLCGPSSAWTPTNPGTCVVSGINQTNFADGVVASFTFTPTSSGTYIFALTGTLGASSAAKAVAVPVGAGAAFSLAITSPCDLNADGKIDISDVQAYLNTFVFAIPASGTINPIASGSSIVDVQRIATAGATGSCITGL